MECARCCRVTGKAQAENSPSMHKPLRQHFGAARVSEITPPLIQSYWSRRHHLPAALREELLELKTTLRLAMRRGFINRLPDIEVPAKRPPREALLTRSQAQALLDEAKHPYFRLYLLIAMTTGARKGAILGLTWDRVDLVRRRIDFRDPTRAITNKRRTIVPVHPTIVEVLNNAQETAETPYVIERQGKPLKNIRFAFSNAAARAGLPWATPHVLKHSVISWLAEDGYTIDQISDMTATHPLTVRRVYRKVSPDYLSDLAESLGEGLSLRSSVNQ